MRTLNFMRSGLEGELELYMGEEFESGSRSLSVQNSDGDTVSIVLQVDESTKTGSISLSAYTQKNGTAVPAATIKFGDLKKVDDRTLIGIAAEIEGHKGVPLRMQVDTGAPPKLIATPGKVAFGQFVPIPGTQRVYTLIGADASTKAADLAAFIKNVSLDKELEQNYEAPKPTVYEKIAAKVDFINDSSLTRKPVQNTPVELTFDFQLGSNKLTISAKQLDTHYVYDVKDLHRLKCNPTGTRIEGPATDTYRYGYLLLGIVDYYTPGYLTIQAFRSEAATGPNEKKLKHDRYIIGDKQEVEKLKNMFVALLKAGHISSLEQEFEFDEEEYEADDFEHDEDFATDYEYEVDDDDALDELENEAAFENELEDDGVTERFARRLHELSDRTFESPYEFEMELEAALETMEDEFMVKRLNRKRKRGKRKGLFKKILSTGAKIIGGVVSKTPVGQLIKAGTSLVKGNVKAALGNLAKAAVGSVLPPGVGGVATAAMDALGGGGPEGTEEGEIRRRRRKAIGRVARIARDTYREVADSLPEDFDHPLVASEVAGKALRKAMVKNGVKPPAAQPAAGAHPRRRVIKLRPGERVVVIG